MNQKETLSPEPKPLTVFVHGGGTLYRAHCPEFDTTFYGETPESAEKGLFLLVEGAAKGWLEGRGDPNDQEIEHAKLVVQTEDISSLFEKNPGPPPPGLGLK